MSEPAARPTPRVLIVDDDADQRFLVRRGLEDVGVHTIEEAADGTEALRKAGPFQPELVVLDLAMPGRSGMDVLPELQLAAPEARVVVFSNRPRHETFDDVRRLGAVGYVEKRTPSERLVHELFLAASLVDATRASGSFPAARTSVRSARLFVRGVLDDVDDHTLASTELLVSELVANAVIHASSSPRVDVHLSSKLVRVEVHDDDATIPTLRDTAPDAPGGGRGLYILDRLASRWGAEVQGSGKVVWFEFDREPSSA